MTADRQAPVTLVLGTTQTLGWGSSYYLPAIFADPPEGWAAPGLANM